jgi:hypothetical protein
MLSQGAYSCSARKLTPAQSGSLLMLSQGAYSCIANELTSSQPVSELLHQSLPKCADEGQGINVIFGLASVVEMMVQNPCLGSRFPTFPLALGYCCLLLKSKRSPPLSPTLLGPEKLSFKNALKCNLLYVFSRTNFVFYSLWLHIL